MVSGARSALVLSWQERFLSWPNVIQIFIRLDNLVKKIQTEGGKRTFFPMLLSQLQMRGTIEKAYRAIGSPLPPQWVPDSWWLTGRALQVFFFLLVCHWVGGPFQSRTQHKPCSGRSMLPGAQPRPGCRGGASAGMDWRLHFGVRIAEK